MPVKFCPRLRPFYLSPLLWVYLSLFLSNGLNGQTVDLAYRNYTIDDGLPSSECYEIIQDSKGYIWISTDNGVSKFDGDHFTNYGPEQGLMNKTILFMHEDHRGWIWMSTLSGNFYIHRADTIAAYEYNYLLQEKRNRYNIIHNFIIDSTGNAHFSLMNHSIFQINENGDTSSWKNNRYSYALGVYVREGKVLQLTEHNFNLPANETQEVYINDLNYPEIEDLKIPRTGNTTSAKLGAYVFLIEDHFFLEYYGALYLFDKSYELKRKLLFSEGSINSVYQLKNGQILIGLFDAKGLIVFDSLASLFNGDSGQIYFNGNTISHLEQDKDGSIWVATTENGIYHIPSLDVNVYHFDLANANFRVGLSSQSGEIFIGAATGQIFTKNDTTAWSELPPIPGLYNLSYLHYFGHEKLLIANSPSKYFDVQNGNSWRSSRHESFSLHGFVDNLNNEIIGFSPDALYSIRYHDDDFIISHKKYNFRNVNCLAQTHPDTIWTGNRSGLFLIKKDSTLQKVNGLSDMLDTNIRDLKVYPDSSLLIATKNNGLLILKHGKIDQISAADGLLDNTINRIRLDTKGQIWVTTKKGLNRLTYQQDSLFITTISVINGLPSNEVIDVAFSKQMTWVVGKQWVTSFPNGFEFEPSPLQVAIPRIQIDGKEQTLDSEITFNWNNAISLHFTAFNYHAYKYQSYRYRLQTHDEWLTTNQSVVSFSNLAPNKYQFEIQALQNDQNWSNSTALVLNVRPPYWQRWWFTGLALLFLTYVIYYLFNQRIQKLKQERERLELEEQINQFKQKAYQAQMNPHFVFNCLNAIQGYIIGGENDQKKAARFLVRFSDLMRQALNYSRKESISLTEEVKLLDNYLSLEQMRFNHKFEYSIELDPALESDWIQIPPLLVQPYIENAVLHGVASLKSKGVIRLVYRLLDEETLEVSISDNGPGISYTKSLKQQNGKMKRESLGMDIAQKRLKTISLRSDNIEITEPYAPDGSVNGTLVKVQIPLNS